MPARSSRTTSVRWSRHPVGDAVSAHAVRGRGAGRPSGVDRGDPDGLVRADGDLLSPRRPRDLRGGRHDVGVCDGLRGTNGLRGPVSGGRRGAVRLRRAVDAQRRDTIANIGVVASPRRPGRSRAKIEAGSGAETCSPCADRQSPSRTSRAIDAVRKADLRSGTGSSSRPRTPSTRSASMATTTYSISGGWFDYQGLSPVRMSIAGCTWGGSVIKCDIVAARGLRLEFGNRVVTSPIREVRVVRDGELDLARFTRRFAGAARRLLRVATDAPHVAGPQGSVEGAVVGSGTAPRRLRGPVP